MCYAEFGSRVPHTTGSAYAYSYHTVGELLAFVIGWNLVLEYMIGTAADARALSSAVDYLADHRLRNFSVAHFGYVPGLHTNVDFLAFLLTIFVTIVLAVGVKESARWSTIFSFLNAGVAVLVIIIGATKAKPSLWDGPERFFPNGAHGVSVLTILIPINLFLQLPSSCCISFCLELTNTFGAKFRRCSRIFKRSVYRIYSWVAVSFFSRPVGT